MDIDNPFDRAIEARFRQPFLDESRDLIGRATSGKSPEDVRDAAIYVTDTLDLMWAAAQAVFESKAKPEHAVAMFGLLAGQMERLGGLLPAPNPVPVPSSLPMSDLIWIHAQAPETIRALRETAARWAAEGKRI